MKSHIDFMKIAIKEGQKGIGRTSPNPPVGAVIVKNGEIIGKGYHKGPGLPHAEIEAINNAKSSIMGGTLYVTLEPCNHHGKTPPCTYEIVKSGINEVVFAVSDPNPLAQGGELFLNENSVNTIKGICEKEAMKLIDPFLHSLKYQRPLVMLKMAMTLDGKIATRDYESKYITSAPALNIVHQYRNQYDAILIGGNTLKRDNPLLNCRLKEGRDPVRIIIDSRMEYISPKNRIFIEGDSKVIVFTSTGLNNNLFEQFENTQVEFIKIPSENNGKLSPYLILEKLYKIGINSVLIEGGAGISGSFMEAKLIDKVSFFYAPKIMLDSKSLNPFNFNKKISLDLIPEIKNVNFDKVGPDFLISGDLVFHNKDF
jgi:diaminohydroxyphosphoribosylaminopyrimidine deaminase / 5-amino-6-(5-phosphoribosylamino)uracil reductase